MYMNEYELFTVKLNKNKDWGMTNYHFHNDCEILFIVDGECECLVETELMTLRRGAVLPLYTTTLHKTVQSSGGEYARYVLRFLPEEVAPFSTDDTDLLNCFHGGRGFIQLGEEDTRELIKLFERCRLGNDGYGSDVRRRNAFLELLIKLGEASTIERSRQRVSTKSFERLRPILTYIAENPAEPLTLCLIAEKFHFNKQYLCRVFKKTTGVSVGDYIASVRIQRACRLLRQGCSVQRSGEESGFSNNSSFITSFGKFVGISPGRYKRLFSGAVLTA